MTANLKKSGNRHAGFTLVELLTVVTILIVVSALGVFVTRGALQKGKETTCLSNLRQLGLAATTYMAENSGQMVPHAIFDTTINENREWCYGYGTDNPDMALKEGILGPYLGDAQDVLKDPTFTYKGNAMEMNGSVPPKARPTTFGFGYNGFYLSRMITTYGQWQGHLMATVDNPDKTVMFATSGEYAGKKVRPYENIWPRQRLAQKVMRAVDGKNAFVCWVGGSVSKVPVVRGTDYDGTVLGHIEGAGGENLFDRFDGDRGDRN